VEEGEAEGGEEKGRVVRKMKKEILVLYFTAKWCPPCKDFGPRLKDACNRVRLIEIDAGIRAGELLALQYSVRSLPTTIVLRTERRDRLVGAVDDQTIEDMLRDA
jgi:thioredoxin-like negative regulator of GroEL